jgi:uncharacterized protein (TIGR03086 family)
MDIVERHRKAVDTFGSRVEAVRADQWENATPCTEWSVRDLVNHLVYESVWTPELLSGKTVEEVGDRFDGYLLGDDPLAAWRSAALNAKGAVSSVEDWDELVNVSWGQMPARDYVEQVTGDYVIHSWDLAKGIDGDAHLDDELAQWVWDYGSPLEPLIRASGSFGPKVEVPDDADVQTKMLGLFGRQA